jgi:hypothetical protein
VRILRRDRRRCRDCGGRATDVHHLWYGRPLGSEPDGALVALCAWCHRQRHAGGWRAGTARQAA